jgi:hypothetical protein
VPVGRTGAFTSAARGRRGATVVASLSVAEALQGADLVLVAGPLVDGVDPSWLAPRAAVLDATGAVDVAPTGGAGGWKSLWHVVSAEEMAVATRALAITAYQVALDHQVGTRLSR